MGFLDFFFRPLALGPRGERAAARFVRRALGYKVLCRNVRCPRGELDIVALHGDFLVFIEVRTRSSDAFTTPEATIRRPKRLRVLRAARWFIQTRRLQALHPRFDTIAIVWPAGQKPKIEHYPNAFSFRHY